MLVITRKAQQTVNIGDEITVTVTKIIGKNVSLAIDAPRNMKIWREELAEDEPKHQKQQKQKRGLE